MTHPATLVSLLDMTMSANAPNLTSEDRGMTAASLVFVNMPPHFWTLLCAIGVVLVVWFLSNVSLDERAEDMTFFQALPIAVLWCALGIALILFNKFLFLPAGSGFDFPFTIFLMWWHAMAGTCATNLLRIFRPSLMPAVRDSTLSLKNYSANVFPIAVLQAMALAFGNTAYLHISVAYIQMVKNTTSAFVFMFSIMLGLEQGFMSNTFAVIMVVIGLLLTTVGEMDFSMIGFMLQMAGTLSDSLRLALTKILLSSKYAVKLDPMSALYFSSPTMLVILFTPMMFIDAKYMTIAKVWEMKYVLFTNALLAFTLNMTSMFFMKRCGATTYALTGVVKDVALILLCCAIFGHPMTTTQLCGFVISLIGFQLYNNLKSDQNYLVKVWYSMRGQRYPEALDEHTSLIETPESKGKMEKLSLPEGAKMILPTVAKDV